MMKVDRRSFLQLTAGSAMAFGASIAPAQSLTRPGFRAVVFDAFPIFDPRPIAALAEALFPGKGPALMDAWRTRQFEYQWLRTLSGHYADFLQATQESLVFATSQLRLELATDKRDRLMSAWSSLRVWPDVPDTISALRKAGMRLAFLSNMTSSMLNTGLANARLSDQFEAVLSTDSIRSYKPDPRSYQMAVDRLKLQREEILFVAFAGWDAAGAKWFGYPTYWVNRLAAPAEALGVEADGSGPDLRSLLQFVAP